MVTLGSLRAQQRPGVVTYRPVPQQTAPPPTPRGGKSGGSGGTVDRGRPSQGGFAPGDSLRLLQQLANDPGVQEATQKKAQKQAENQAWDQASFKDKLGVSIGKVLQPMDYLSYLRRAVQTGVLELEEVFLNESDKTPQWMKWATAKPEQLNWFEPPDDVRAGRSNWDLISGKEGVRPNGETAKPLGGGALFKDIPSGPAIGPSWLNVKPGQVADRVLGAVLDVGMDPLTHSTTGGFQVVSPAQRTARAAENLSTAAGTQVDDLERLLSKIGQGEKVTDEEIAQAVSRTSQGLDIADRAQQVAATTKPGAKVIPLPRGKLGRAQFAYELRTELPTEVWDSLKDDVAYAVAHGFEQASPELKEAARILPGGLRMYGFRVPGTAVVGKAAGAARAGLAAHAPAKWGELRDPEGLGPALDTLARGKGGNIDTAITRIGHEDISRVATGRVRVLADGIANKFHAEILKPLKRQGGTAVADALHEAETVGDTALNQVFQDALKTFERVSGKPIDPQFLLDQKTYIPHQLTKPFRRYLRKREAEASVKAFSEETAFMTDDVLDQATAIARKRSLVPNADGTPRVYKMGDREVTITDGSIRDLNEALKDTFPDFKGKFYEDDPEVLLKSYIQMRGKEAGILAADAVLSADPKAGDIYQLIGEKAALLDARNAAMQRDPTNQLITEGYDPAKATEFAQQHLGAPRGPGQEAPIGPQLPNAENWVDTDPMFASKVDTQASFIRHNETLGQGADFREAAQIAQGVADKEARKGLDDLRGTLIEDLKKPWRHRSKTEVGDMAKRITNIRKRLSKLVAKDQAAVDEIEAIQGRATLDLEDLSAEVVYAQDDLVQGVSRAEQLALKDMKDRLAELKQLRDEAAAKLETAPQAMRDEAKARLDALMAPVRKAQKELADAEEMAGRTVSPTRLRNAQRVMDDVPEAYAVDKARRAEIDSLIPDTPKADLPALRAERRVLAKKFAKRGGEYSRIVNAEETLADRARAEGVAGNLDRLRSRVETARTVAEQQQEIVVRGRMTDPEPWVHGTGGPNAGEPMHEVEYWGPHLPEIRQSPEFPQGRAGHPALEVPTDIVQYRPPEQTYISGETGFGVGEVREPVIPPKQMTPYEQRMQAAARGRRQAGLSGGGRTEQEAIGKLEAEAARTEAGQGPVAGEVKFQEGEIKAVEDAIAQGVSGHPLVEAARVQGEESIRQAEEAVSARLAQENSDKAIMAGRRAQIAQDEARVTGELNQALADKDVLVATRKQTEKEQRLLQRELRAMAVGARTKKGQTFDELLDVYDDLELVAEANPSVTSKSMQSVEIQLNRVADGLHSANAMKMTDAHVAQVMKDAQNGKLGNVMYTTLGSGWKALHNGPLRAGDTVFSAELARQMKNLYKMVDEPVWVGRVFNQLTNLFKTYATLLPGFHVRNGLSAIFMNTADDVSLKAQAQGALVWTKFMRAYRKGQGYEFLEAQTPQMREAIHAVAASGAGGRYGEAGFADAGSSARKLWQWMNSNWVTRKSQHLGEWVEGGVRLGMAIDSIAKGSSGESALQRISRIHFDYAQVSKMDKFMKQLIPFWTYYSRNLPLQIQMMYTQPKAYSWFMSAVGQAPPDEEWTPQYWNQPGNFNTGKQLSSGMLYGNFDMPFSRSAEQIADLVQLTQGDMAGTISQFNPWFVAPVEWLAGQDFFTGANYDRKDPDSYQKLSGVMGWMISTLGGIQNQNDPAGRTYTPYTNMIRSVLPMVDRSARMDPTGMIFDVEGQQQKEPMWTSYARWGGAPIRVLTPEQQKSAQKSDFYDRRDNMKLQQAAARYLASHQGN